MKSAYPATRFITVGNSNLFPIFWQQDGKHIFHGIPLDLGSLTGTSLLSNSAVSCRKHLFIYANVPGIQFG